MQASCMISVYPGFNPGWTNLLVFTRQCGCFRHVCCRECGHILAFAFKFEAPCPVGTRSIHGWVFLDVEPVKRARGGSPGRFSNPSSLCGASLPQNPPRSSPSFREANNLHPHVHDRSSRCDHLFGFVALIVLRICLVALSYGTNAFSITGIR